MAYLLFSLLLIVAVAVTYFVTKKKAFNSGYHCGELNERENSTITRDSVINWTDNIQVKGFDPIKGIEIMNLTHKASNGKDIVPFFAANMKFKPNNERPDLRAFIISTNKHDPVHITPSGVSDGFHTFDELYYYRLCYNAALINSLVQLINDNPAKFKDIKVCKSKKHFGGEPCYGGGWFIVMINTPWGQISNHYKLEYWDMFNCRVADTSWKWDGHGMKEAMERLNKLSKFIATGKLY